MKILVLHNDYAKVSGEETSLNHVVALLESRGNTVLSYRRSSAEIETMRFGKSRALLSGLYCQRSRDAVRRIVAEFAPDVALVKNLYPLISPSVLPVIAGAGVPIVMWVANYRLVCPNGLHLSHGIVCERCAGGREYWCALRNCEGSLAKSIGYALRNHAARTMGWYREHVTRFISASEFLRSKLIAAGFDASRIHVLRNPIPDPVGSADVLWTGAGSYVGYAGRLSPEKGIATILNAAALCPAVEFRLAGKLSDALRLPHPLPRNVRLVGFLRKDQLAEFYKEARLIISASECYESFGMSVAEAMLHARPVIASRIGVFPEWVRERVNGMLFEPGDAEELAEKVRVLWDRPDLCWAMGEAGRRRALTEYSPDTYYRQFLEMCREMQTMRAAA